MKRYPEVNAATELLYISRAIFNDPREIIVPDQEALEGPWVWDGPKTYEPRIQIRTGKFNALELGSIMVNHAVLRIIDGSVECSAHVDARTMHTVPDDSFMLDLLSAFRQYSPLSVVVSETIPEVAKQRVA